MTNSGPTQLYSNPLFSPILTMPKLNFCAFGAKICLWKKASIGLIIRSTMKKG